MASQDSHGSQSILIWSRPRYQTSAELQPTVYHSLHACTIQVLGVLYVLKKTLNYPQSNCQPGVSKLRVVAKYMPKVKRLVGV
jgi:hypothetical protein